MEPRCLNICKLGQFKDFLPDLILVFSMWCDWCGAGGAGGEPQVGDLPHGGE